MTRNFVLFNCIFNLFFTSKLLQCFPSFETNQGVYKFANQNMFCFSKRRRHNLITSVVLRSDSETISFCAFKNYTKFYLILLFAIKFSNVLHKNQVQFPCQSKVSKVVLIVNNVIYFQMTGRLTGPWISLMVAVVLLFLLFIGSGEG